jgi:hypothetical protein
MGDNRYSRQILAFGDEGQKRLAQSRVGVVGLGGMGSQVLQALAYLGVGSLVLVDHDHVEDTNLNRLVGAVPSDVSGKSPKTFVARRMVQGINPATHVESIAKNLRSHEALDALITCPVIFGCVDHDAPRLILSELAAAYEITLVDVATEIIAKNGVLKEFGGRVVMARPGEYCLDCAGQLDRDQAKWELLSPEAKEVSRHHGYGLGEDTPAPAVVSLNGVVANIAVTEYLAMVTGIRAPNKHITYYGLRGMAQNSVTVRSDPRREDCYICCSLVGARDAANVYRYVMPDSE